MQRLLDLREENGHKETFAEKQNNKKRRGVALAFSQSVRNAIVEQDVLREPSKAYSPSSMKCARNMFYKRSGYETDPEPREHNMIGITESGTDRHDRLQNQIFNAKDIKWIDVEEHIKEYGLSDIHVRGREGLELQLFDTKYNISFRCDGIVEYEGERYLLEIKTETSNKWQDRKDVDPSHIDQITMYSICLGLDEAIFIYENRNNCLKKTYIVEVTEEHKEVALKRISRADIGYKMGKEPEAEPSKDNCMYCRYKIYCDAAIGKPKTG